MRQTWKSLTFLHWRYDPEVIGRLLPAGVMLDTFEGAAWVGLAPFVLVDLRPPFCPALPWISHFPEMNVRTYVRGPDGKPGVWFFTLEADRLAAVIGARVAYGLPYRWARMRVVDDQQVVTYISDRRWPFGQGRARISVRPGEPMDAKRLDNFLTARYRLYTRIGKRIAFAEIEHEPWELRDAEVLELEQNVIEHSSVPTPVGEPLVHFSRDLAVRIGRPRWARS